MNEILSDKIAENKKDFIEDFFKQRIEWLLKQLSIEYDVIESVMHIDFSNIPDLVSRANALQNMKKQDNFIKLVLGFKRVSNIIENINVINEVDENLFQAEMDIKLFENYNTFNSKIQKLLTEKKYQRILLELIDFGKTIDNFFDKVLVNVEDEAVKNNRYNLLNVIRNLFLQVADISKIVVEG